MFLGRKRKFLFISVLFSVTGFFYGCAFDDTMMTGTAEKKSFLTLNESGTFRIMQLTDLHLTSNGTLIHDWQTLRWIEEAVTEYRPDIVELTGDAVAGPAAQRNKALLALANLFEKHEIDWAYTFGNHDGEHAADGTWAGKEGKQHDLLKYCPAAADTIDKNKVKTVFYGDNATQNLEIFNLLKGYKHSLLRRSDAETADTDAMGVGNYVIEVKDKSGKTVFTLFHMDSHGKIYVDPVGNKKGPDGYADVGYAGLTEAQIRWYRETVKPYSDSRIPGALFMHVPHFAYRSALETQTGLSEYGVPQFKERENLTAYLKANQMIPDAFADYGFVKQEDIYGPRWDDGLEAAMTDCPSTNLVSTGHDHNNCFIIRRQKSDDAPPVLLAYGRTTGVNAWGRDVPIGATIFEVTPSKYDPAHPEAMYRIRQVHPSFPYIRLGTR